MGKIQVNNIKLYANHGCLEEEAKIGSWYRVDVQVSANLDKSSVTDNLNDTVDYVHLNYVIKEEMSIRSKLLEEVARRIQRLKDEAAGQKDDTTIANEQNEKTKEKISKINQKNDKKKIK